jgi:hypothetical protein
MGRGGITTPNHFGRLQGKGAILLRVSHRPAWIRFFGHVYRKSGGADVGAGLRREPMAGA